MNRGKLDLKEIFFSSVRLCFLRGDWFLQRAASVLLRSLWCLFYTSYRIHHDESNIRLRQLVEYFGVEHSLDAILEMHDVKIDHQPERQFQNFKII